MSNKKVTKETIFTVPFSLGEIKEELTINTNTPSNLSKKELIDKAFTFHSQGQTSKAKKLYEYFINQGFVDAGVFSNYGTILTQNGETDKAIEIYNRTIKLFPYFATSYYNLAEIYIHCEELDKAEEYTRKTIETYGNH